MMKKKIFLKPNAEKFIIKGHPWIYKEAVQEPLPSLELGDEVVILNSNGNFLGLGYADPKSNILIRVVSGNKNISSIVERIISNISYAATLRKNYFIESITNAYRVINGEGDGIPGLVVDKYNKVLVIQLYSLGLEKYIDAIVDKLLKEFPDINWIWKRDHVRKANSRINGLIYGRNAPNKVEILENSLKFIVNIAYGQKTGFYLDQRENRLIIKKISNNKVVANLCGYTGAFSVYATSGNAKHVITLDISKPALEEAKSNLQINNFSLINQTFINADIFEKEGWEKLLSDYKNKLDIIILDPPALAHNKNQIKNALKAYKKINSYALKLLQKGGILFTASCTAFVDKNAFLQVISETAYKLGKKLKLLSETYQPIDHPVALFHPEGRYLKAFLLEVIE